MPRVAIPAILLCFAGVSALSASEPTGTCGRISFDGRQFEVRDEAGKVYPLDAQWETSQGALAAFLRDHEGKTFSALVVPEGEMRRVFLTSPVHSETKVTERMRAHLDRSKGELIPVVIMMRDQLQVDALQAMASNLTRQEARQFIPAESKKLAEATQRDLRELLERESRKQNRATRLKFLWSPNAVSALVAKDLVAEIAALPSVAQVDLSEERQVIP